MLNLDIMIIKGLLIQCIITGVISIKSGIVEETATSSPSPATHNNTSSSENNTTPLNAATIIEEATERAFMDTTTNTLAETTSYFSQNSTVAQINTTTTVPSNINTTSQTTTETTSKHTNNTTQYPRKTTSLRINTTTQFQSVTTSPEINITTQFPSETTSPRINTTTQFPSETKSPRINTTTQFPSETTSPQINTTTEYPSETTSTRINTTSQFPNETTSPRINTTTQFPSESTSPRINTTTQFPSETISPRINTTTPFLNVTIPTTKNTTTQFPSKTTSPRINTTTTPPESPPQETAPPETVPPETAPPETAPPETMPPDTPSPETPLRETTPSETMPPETPPPETAQPETPPPETTQSTTMSPETTPPETMPPETTPLETPPRETMPSETPPPETPPPETAQTETPPPETTPSTTMSPETLAPETMPPETTPLETPPPETTPPATPQAETTPSETPPTKTQNTTEPPPTEPTEALVTDSETPPTGQTQAPVTLPTEPTEAPGTDSETPPTEPTEAAVTDSETPPTEPTEAAVTDSETPPTEPTEAAVTDSETPPTEPTETPVTDSETPPTEPTETPVTDSETPPTEPTETPVTDSETPPTRQTETLVNNSETPPTEPTEAAVTDSETPPTEPTETPVTDSETPPTRQTETLVTNSETPPTEPTEAAVTDSETPPTEPTEDAVTNSETPPTEPTETPVTDSETPPTRQTETLVTNSETPPTEPTEAAVTDSETPPTEPTEAPVTDLQTPPIEPTETPVTDSEIPSTEPTETPVTDSEIPSTEPSEAPVTDSEIPSTEPTEAPVTDSETPPTEPTETPVTDLQTPPIEPTENTGTKSPKTTTSESLGTEILETTATESPETTVLTESPDTSTTENPKTTSTEPLEITTTEFIDMSTVLLGTPESTTDANIVQCVESVDNKGTDWGTTEAGVTRTLECGNDYTGLKTRRCSVDGEWEKPIYNCIKATILNIYTNALELDFSSTEDDIANVLSQGLGEASFVGETLTASDVVTLVDVLDVVSTLLLTKTPISNTGMVQTFTDLASSVIDPTNGETFESLFSQGDSTGEKVLVVIDTLVEVVGNSLDTLTNGGYFNIAADNLDFKVEKAIGDPIIYPNLVDVNSEWVLDSGSSLVFDVSSLSGSDIEYTVASMTYKDLSSVLPISSEDQQELNGQIMSVSTFPAITGSLSTPISLTFRQNNNMLTRPVCSYWDFGDDLGTGTWATDGCTVTETSESHTTCSCTHLTNFALLLTLQDCGIPNSPTNGNVVFDETTYTSIVEYSCEQGYLLTGSLTSQCLYDGLWSGTDTACTEIEEEIKLCPLDTDSNGRVWVETPPSETREKLCQTGFTGKITRLCKSDSTWQWPQNTCIRDTVLDIEEQVDNSDADTTENEISETVQEIRNITDIAQYEGGETDEKLTDGEIYVLSTSLEKIGDLVQNDTAFATDAVVNNFVESASNLIDEANQDSWQALVESDIPGAESLLTAVTSLVEAVGQTLNQTESKTVVKKNLAVEAKKYTSTDVVFPVPQQLENEEFEWVKDTKSQIKLEKESLKDDSYVITMVMYKDISRVLPSDIDKSTTTSAETREDESKINGPILAMTITPKENAPSVFDPPITITFEHKEDNLTSPLCSFWRFNNGSQGVWSSSGCWMNSTNASITICQCDHLTNFAVLMSPFSQADSTSKALRIISIVGISISICCILATFLVHICFWRYLRNDRTTILMNLCVSLFLAYIVFLAGIDRTESKVGCAIVAGALQYLYLVVFCVMLVGGIEIAITVLYVFKTKSRIKILLIAAWVLPGLIVAISAGVTQGVGYGGDAFCWLSIDDGLIWAFVGPALIIIFFNTICIILVLRAMCGTSTMKIKKTQDKVRASLRSLCVLVPVMGISWLLGIFYVNDGFYFVQFIFAIFNGLQGLFIFIFHCVLNSQVRKVIKQRQRRKRSSQGNLHSNSKVFPKKDSKLIHSKDTNSYVEDSGVHSNSSGNQMNDNLTNHFLQPQLKLNGGKFSSPMTSNGTKNLRPASTFSSQSRAQLSSAALSTNHNSSRQSDHSWNQDDYKL